MVDPQTLAQHLRELRAAGRTAVQCHGCFDLVHPGHLRYLQFARQLGHELIVSLTGDAAIAKGPDRPFIPQELRAENLAALEFVDWVVIDPNPTAETLLRILRPDVYVKGQEYAVSADPRFVREREIVESYGGRVVFHSGDVVFSSTRLMQSRARDSRLDACRLGALCRRCGIDLASLQRVLAAMRGMPVLILGDCVRERQVYCDPEDSAEDAPVQTLRQIDERVHWSGAAAVALQAAELGARPVVIGAAGDGPTWDGLRELLSNREIEHELPSVRSELIERVSFLGDDTRLLTVLGGQPLPADLSIERKLLDCAAARLSDAALLIWADCGYGSITPGLQQALTERARALGIPRVGLAPGPRGQIARIAGAELLVTTERRLRRALQDRSSSVNAVAWNLLASAGAERMLVRLHKRGVLCFEKRDAESVGEAASHLRLKGEFIPDASPARIDDLGVEECVSATAGMALAGCGSLPLAAYLAVAIESICSGRAGVAPATDADLYAWMDERSELRPESRFLPDASTLSDLARLAPPVDRAAWNATESVCAASPKEPSR